MIERNQKCLYCGKEFTTTNSRKRYCNKQHADRSRNGTYDQPAPVTWESITDLRHFGKLDEAGKQKVLLGGTDFSVVMYDIEATHLKANVGRILCCSFKPLGQPVYTIGALDPGMKRQDVYDDSALAGRIRDELEKYDIIVGWNSAAFDTRFINARAARVGQRIKKQQYQIDAMWSWRTKMAAWSSLAHVQAFLGTETGKTPIAWSEWMRALSWSKKLREAAMQTIITHCEHDVTVLEEVYKAIVQSNMVRSIKKDGGVI